VGDDLHGGVDDVVDADGGDGGEEAGRVHAEGRPEMLLPDP
jgi:hypothetical protein